MSMRERMPIAESARGEISHRLVTVLRDAAALVDRASVVEEWRAADDDDIVRPFDKMLIEAALLAFLARRAVGDTDAVRALAYSVAAQEDALARLFAYIQLRPHLWTTIGLVWIVLDDFDLGDRGRREAVRTLFGEGTVQPHERVTYRILDQAWVRSVARRRWDDQLDARELLAACAIGNLAAAPAMTTSDLYGVTHAAMYSTDFGRRPSPLDDEGWLSALAAHRLLIGDFDLAVELAMADICVNGRLGAGSRLVVAGTVQVFAALGCVPSPSYRNSSHLQSPDPSTYRDRHSYHSTFVFGLLCATALVVPGLDAAPFRAQSTTMPREWDGRRADAGGLHAQVVHTHREWSRLAGSQDDLASRDVLAVVADAYLIRAAAADAVADQLALLRLREALGESSVAHEVRKTLDVRRTMARVRRRHHAREFA